MDIQRRPHGPVGRLVGALLMASAYLVTATGPAHAATPMPNGAIADKALTYVGRSGSQACIDSHQSTNGFVGQYWGGECKQFVNCIVSMASGGTISSSGYTWPSGTVVSSGDATKGDIIQSTGQVLHTAIIVSNLGAGRFDVVDSNFNAGQARDSQGYPVVWHHSWSPYVAGATITIYRLGTLTTAPPPPVQASSTRASDGAINLRGDFNGDGKSDVLVVSPRGASGLNFVPLLSTGSGFTHGGLWFNTGSDYTVDSVRFVVGDFNGDGKSDVLVVSPRGASGLNFVPLLSTGSGFTHGGLWFNTGSDYTVDSVRFVVGDFNGDGKSDVLVVSPRGASGLNFVPLLSTGSGFTHGGLWFNTGSDYTVDSVRFASGDFNGDGKSDVLVVSPRGASGLNFVPLLSTGSGFTHGGLWFNTGSDYTVDSVRFASGDFNGDGKSDVLVVSPRGASGLNFVPLLSTGSGFTHGGLWFNTGSDYTVDSVRFASGDFNGDGKSDVLVVSPRGASGLNFVPLLSTGSGFTHGGLWFNTGSDYTVDSVAVVG